MRILIDGHNLLHATRWLNAEGTDVARPDISAEERRLIHTLAEKCGAAFSRCTVVFDSKTPAPLWAPRRETIQGIEVIRAIDEPSADDVLVEMIAHDTGPRDLVVVTSDNRIRSAARQRRIQVIRSENFWSWVDQVGTAKEPASDDEKEREKPAVVTEEEKKRALRQFTEHRAKTPHTDPKARRPRRARLRLRTRRVRRLR